MKATLLKFLWWLRGSVEYAISRLTKARKPVVYFVCADEVDAIKIGFTADLDRRIQQLQTSSPFKLRLIGVLPCESIADEKAIHNRFEDLRIAGEWFRPCEDLSRFIIERCDGVRFAVAELKEIVETPSFQAVLAAAGATRECNTVVSQLSTLAGEMK